LEGISRSAAEPERSYRGYVAVDDIQILPIEENSGLCHGKSSVNHSLSKPDNTSNYIVNYQSNEYIIINVDHFDKKKQKCLQFK
jgi:hypothetical protein